MRKTSDNFIQLDDLLDVTGDIVVEETTEDDQTEIEDLPPHLVLLIPGIRSDGLWTQKVIESEFTIEGQEIEFRSVRGDGKSSTGRLSAAHLVLRFNLHGFRKNILQAIEVWSQKFPNSPVSIFAHSMGSSLLSEIISDAEAILQKQGKKLNVVAFLGSVCHRKHSRKMFDSCELFVNDVGVLDMWPWRASTVRPNNYSDVGLHGFGDSLSLERRYGNDHASCTSKEHIQQNLLPLLSTVEVRPKGHSNTWPSRPHHEYQYVRRLLQASMVALIPLAGLSFWKLGLWTTLLLSAIYIATLSYKLFTFK